MLQVSLDLTISRHLIFSWSFQDFQGPTITFSVPRDLRTICSLREVCKSLYKDTYDIWIREKAIQCIRNGMVVDHSNGLTWFFPDVPWQLFSRVGNQIIPRYGIYGVGDYISFGRTSWSLTPYREGTHVCCYDTPLWILNNEEDSDRLHHEMETQIALHSDEKIGTCMESQWYYKCRGWNTRSRRRNYREADFLERKGRRKLIIKTHETGIVSFKSTIPEVVRRRSKFFRKKLYEDGLIYRFNQKAFSYFLTRDVVEIHPSVEPIDLEVLLTLPKSRIKKLNYRRIGEVPEELLIKLRDILLPELLCLEGDWNPCSAVEKVFGPEIWHLGPNPVKSFARIRNEIYYLGEWRRGRFEYESGHEDVNAFTMLSILRGERSNGYYIFPPNGWECPHDTRYSWT